MFGSYIFVTKVKKLITWQKARAACQKRGGDLAVLTTYKAVDAIAPFIKNDKDEYWVGATNPSKKKENWKWLSGEPIPLSFEKWSPGVTQGQQPDGNGDCLAYCPSGLCDWGCENSAEGYICQIPSK